jgi:phosphate transport system protein
MERGVPHFQEELEGLQARLLEMGGLAEERVRAAVNGLVARDTTLIDKVMRGDEPVNELHIEIDNRCFTLLALHQPMAGDLRSIVAAVKINTDLERVGDLAVNIAEAARRYTNHPAVKKLVDIPQMGDIAQAMLRDALDSFVRRDTRLAHQVLEGFQVLGSPGVGGGIVEGDEGRVAADLVPDHCFMYCRITLEKSLPPWPSTECFW